MNSFCTFIALLVSVFENEMISCRLVYSIFCKCFLKYLKQRSLGVHLVNDIFIVIHEEHITGRNLVQPLHGNIRNLYQKINNSVNVKYYIFSTKSCNFWPKSLGICEESQESRTALERVICPSLSGNKVSQLINYLWQT